MDNVKLVWQHVKLVMQAQHAFLAQIILIDQEILVIVL